MPKSDDEMSDDQNGDLEDAPGSDDKETSPQLSATKNLLRHDAPDSVSAHDLQERFSQISLENYDTIKYTGSSAGLRVLNKSLFKDGQVLWPGRQNVVLQMLPQDEVVVLKTDLSESGSPQVKMGIGIGMQMGIFGSDTKGWSPDNACRKNCLYTSMVDRYITLDERKTLVDAYFRKIHPVLPILNKRRFLQQYEDGTVPAVLLLCVLLVAYRYVKPEDMRITADNEDFGEYLYKRIMTYLRCYASKSVIHIIQANLLMVVYLDLEDSDTESIQWYALGTAIRMAQELGLHRSSAHWKIPKSEIETRHRLFFACYILDRWIGARCGKPLTILDRDFDTGFPNAYEVHDSDDASNGSLADDNRDTDMDEEPPYLAFIHLIKLSEILGRILKALYAPKAKYANHNAGIDDPTILLVFDRRLNHWKATLDAGMIPKGKGEPKPDPDNPDQTEAHNLKIDPQHRVMLDMCYHVSQLLLHRQFIQVPTVELDSAMEDLINHSHSVCTQAAVNINVIAQEAEFRHFIGVSPTTLIYAVFQAALIHMYNINSDKMKMQSKFNLKRSMGFLSKRRKWVAVSRVIEILKLMATLNSIDGHIFASTSEDDQAEAPHAAESSSTTTAKKKRRSRTASKSASNQDAIVKTEMVEATEGEHYEESMRPTIIPAYLPFNYDLVVDEMPKGQWIQRMMSTSVVGGITPDIQASISSLLSVNNAMSRTDSHMQGMESQQPTNMNPTLPNVNMRPATMPQQMPDTALIPWHHLQMLSQQSYVPYPMYAAHNPQQEGSMHAAHPNMYGAQQPYPIPVNPNLSNKPEFQQGSQSNVAPTMFQQQHPPLAGSLPRPRQDANTLMPPGSLNWEDWNSYVDQETNRQQ
ncbi:hypothetical protein INT44_005264 [Umbelopsis vinacea]|uniref:Xylanolytic transcriptional activator regulatory domain-containing protein n=1 Tax=Umbelopsis vinacea TaxID=44442 RepID=A0A8H7Q927_9FUNG|nr:hypothetical protein INT44_005264 [Umbelopsis vinacea]